MSDFIKKMRRDKKENMIKIRAIARKSVNGISYSQIMDGLEGTLKGLERIMPKELYPDKGNFFNFDTLLANILPVLTGSLLNQYCQHLKNEGYESEEIERRAVKFIEDSSRDMEGYFDTIFKGKPFAYRVRLIGEQK